MHKSCLNLCVLGLLKIHLPNLFLYPSCNLTLRQDDTLKVGFSKT